MNPSDVTLFPEARERLDAWLDAIDARLRETGMERDARRGITDDVEGQVLETLAARVGATPSAEDVASALAEMDPPAAYAADAPPTGEAPPLRPSPGPTRPAKQRLSRVALLGLLWAPLALLALVVVGLFWYGYERQIGADREARARAEEQAALERERELLLGMEDPRRAVAQGHPDGAEAEVWTGEVETTVTYEEATWLGIPALLLSLLSLTAPIGTTVCGIVAIVQIRASKGRLYGMPLAIFDTVLFPGLAILLAVGALVLGLLMA